MRGGGRSVHAPSMPAVLAEGSTPDRDRFLQVRSGSVRWAARCTAQHRVAIVRGHGQVARQLIHVLRRGDHDVVALVRRRNTGRGSGEPGGPRSRLLDIERDDADAFAAAFEGCSAVVFAAGGPTATSSANAPSTSRASAQVDRRRGAGGDRPVHPGVRDGVDDPLPDDTGDVWRADVEAKRDADAALRDSGLAWTIRPGRLTDDPATGTVSLGRTSPAGT